MPEPSIAIVGSGPSGCYLAQSLRRLWPSSEIALIERLPVPFGLLRYGVAGDHQGTKAISRQFEKLFEQENVALLAGVEVENHITLDDLRLIFDVVVLATGLTGDRRLGIPSETLPGVYGSGRITRWLNRHPDETAFKPEFGRRCVIIGNGNVALDLGRMLAKSESERSGTDLPGSEVLSVVDELREITIVGRGTPEKAKFDPVLVKEMAKLSNARVMVVARPQANDESPSELRQGNAIRSLDGAGGGIDKNVTFRFELHPVTFEGTDCLIGLVCRDVDGNEVRLPATSVIKAIGFDDHPHSRIRRDRYTTLSDCLPPNLGDGLFVSGWLRRGPNGTIPENRKDALEVAQAVQQAIANGTVSVGKRGLLALYGLLNSRGVEWFDSVAWSVIRRYEERSACGGRIRRKVRDVAQMREWLSDDTDVIAASRERASV